MSNNIKKTKVLVIEDDVVDFDLLRRSLSKLTEFDLERAGNLTQGLERIRQGNLDIVLLDLGLPETTGLEALDKALAKTEDIPIVVLTGLEDDDIGTQAVRKGAQDYLVKGRINTYMLARAIRYAIDRHRMERRLREAQKMQAVGQLASGVAHEFNNLLTSIKGYAQLITTYKGYDDKLYKNTNAIIKSANRAAELVQELLTFSNQQASRAVAFDINAKISNMGIMLKSLMDPGKEIHMALAPDLAGVHADPWQFEQVILNLTMNARDAMSTNDTLTITTQNITIDESFRLEQNLHLQAGQYVQLDVNDTGTGIPPEKMARIFEPFYSTKDIGKGTGLGLSTVYGIVRQNSGDIHVTSKEGKGTTFSVYFPIAPAAAGS